MKCPILEIGWMQTKVGQKGQSSDCLKEECACWSALYERCDPTGLAHTLERLTDILAEIERKMPHELQFRK